MRSLQVPLQQEVVFLEHYVAIQKHRFQERLTVSFDIAPEALAVLVPSLFLQPLVENAIHHGIGKQKGSDRVEVTARRQGDELVLRISNYSSSLTNGAPSAVPTSGHGVGLKNTRARLEQMYGTLATLELISLQPSGVCTRVTIPVESAA
jgi:two-component system LytT family sensor kinase